MTPKLVMDSIDRKVEKSGIDFLVYEDGPYDVFVYIEETGFFVHDKINNIYRLYDLDSNLLIDNIPLDIDDPKYIAYVDNHGVLTTTSYYSFETETLTTLSSTYKPNILYKFVSNVDPGGGLLKTYKVLKNNTDKIMFFQAHNVSTNSNYTKNAIYVILFDINTKVSYLINDITIPSDLLRSSANINVNIRSFFQINNIFYLYSEEPIQYIGSGTIKYQYIYRQISISGEELINKTCQYGMYYLLNNKEEVVRIDDINAVFEIYDLNLTLKRTLNKMDYVDDTTPKNTVYKLYTCVNDYIFYLSRFNTQYGFQYLIFDINQNKNIYSDMDYIYSSSYGFGYTPMDLSSDRVSLSLKKSMLNDTYYFITKPIPIIKDFYFCMMNTSLVNITDWNTSSNAFCIIKGKLKSLLME